MEYNWKDVKLSVLGKELDIVPTTYTDAKKTDILLAAMEIDINLCEDEFNNLKKHLQQSNLRKLTNYQRKKLWKKFNKTFNIQ